MALDFTFMARQTQPYTDRTWHSHVVERIIEEILGSCRVRCAFTPGTVGAESFDMDTAWIALTRSSFVVLGCKVGCFLPRESHRILA